MTHKSIRKLIPLLISLVCTTNVYAQDRVQAASVDVSTNMAYTAEQALNAMQGRFSVNEGMLEDISWIIMTVNDKEFLEAENGREFMNQLYPSGIRLSTMLLDPGDTKYTATDYSPLYYGDEAILLRTLMPNRVNFTYSEIKAAEKYYRMIQAKSIAMGLPVFSFRTEFSGNYSADVISAFSQAVQQYEAAFGPIGFPDTSSLDFDWVGFVETSKKVDLKDMIIPDGNVSDYRIPSGVKTLELFTNYYTNSLEELQEIAVFADESEENLPLLDGYSYDVKQAYRYACVYMPEIISNYDNLYSDIYVDAATGITLLSDYLNQVPQNHSDTALGESRQGNLYATDPYVIALQNQSQSPISSETLDSVHSQNISASTLFHSICIGIAIIAVLAILLTKIITYLRSR